MGQTEEPKHSKSSTLNSLLLVVTIAVLGFIGNETWGNGKKLEAISAAQITRPEFETRLSEIRMAHDLLRAKLVELEVAIAKIQRSATFKPSP